MFTGEEVYKILRVRFDTNEEIDPPDFSDENSEWKCAFIQSTHSGRMLEPDTQFLYCKLDFVAVDEHDLYLVTIFR